MSQEKLVSLIMPTKHHRVPVDSLPGSSALKNDQRIELVPIDRLTPYKGNARTHSKRQLRGLAKSVKRFGFLQPVLIDDKGGIIAGHGRVEAAKLLGLKETPAIRISHLTAEEKRAFIIADNRLSELAGWDQEALALELQGLVDLNFDIEATGFELGEIDVLLDNAEEEKHEPAAPEDNIPEPVRGPTVTQPGDIWLLNNHRVICGDARDDAIYQCVLDGEKAAFVFTDPPYNVAVAGHASRKERDQHPEFAMAAGEMSPEAFTDFLSTSFKNLVAHSTDGSLHDICMDWRHLVEMMTAGNKVYSELKNLCVWAKTNPGMGTFYRSQHELVFVWKAGDGPHTNNIEFAPQGRVRSNVWRYAGTSTMSAGRLEELAMHPTTKPVALVADAIRDCSHRNQIVLDPFMGSGTTLIAAERTGRRARGIEIDPAYVDVTVRRWQAYTGKAATLATSGQTFEDLQEERSHSNAQNNNQDGKNDGDKPLARAA
jgi:DNA modification methylase